MKRVEPRHENDCAAASLAAILELPIEDVPDFWNQSKTATAQYKRIRSWLAGRGYHWYFSTIAPRQMCAFRTEKIEQGCSWPPRGYWLGQIARVEWLRDNEPSHMVVMLDRRCVFSPNSTLAETREPDVWLTGYYLLVPLDPALREVK